jgi:hypothetical protein
LRLSEAILIGCKLRPESHRERFVVTENDGVLRSDAWGAACEAVQPAVAHFNWTAKDKFRFETAMDALRAIQQHYFKRYFSMPARCPLASQRFTEAGGRIINRQGEMKITGERTRDIGGVTSECDKVEHLAGFVDHAFYKHGWSREQVAEAVEWYEQTREQAVASPMLANFQHYQVN